MGFHPCRVCAVLIQTTVCIPGVQFCACNWFLWQFLGAVALLGERACANIKHLKHANGSQAVMQQQYEKFSLMAFVQRVELRLVPAILPLPCTGHVALSPSDPHSSFLLSLLFLLSINPSHCSALVLLADGMLLFFFFLRLLCGK